MKKISAIALAVLALSGCESLSSPVVRFDRQVNYGDAKAVELVTNEFGSTDLQMIAEKMVGSLLESGAFEGRPLVTISSVKNKTSENIDHQRDELHPNRPGEVGPCPLHALDRRDADRGG